MSKTPIFWLKVQLFAFRVFFQTICLNHLLVPKGVFNKITIEYTDTFFKALMIYKWNLRRCSNQFEKYCSNKNRNHFTQHKSSLFLFFSAYYRPWTRLPFDMSTNIIWMPFHIFERRRRKKKQIKKRFFFGKKSINRWVFLKTCICKKKKIKYCLICFFLHSNIWMYYLNYDQ